MESVAGVETCGDKLPVGSVFAFTAYKTSIDDTSLVNLFTINDTTNEYDCSLNEYSDMFCIELLLTDNNFCSIFVIKRLLSSSEDLVVLKLSSEDKVVSFLLSECLLSVLFFYYDCMKCFSLLICRERKP